MTVSLPLYSVISADCPWPQTTFSPKGLAKAPEAHYKTIPLEELCAMPVYRMAQDNCALCLWTSGTYTEMMFLVARAWGFPFYSGKLFTWLKPTLDSWRKRSRIPLEYKMNLGHTTRKNTEEMYLFWRGTQAMNRQGERAWQKGLVPRVRKDVTEVMEAPDWGEDEFFSPDDAMFSPGPPYLAHSEKPMETYSRIEALWGQVPRIELFARTTDRNRNANLWGWDRTGLEYNGELLQGRLALYPDRDRDLPLSEMDPDEFGKLGRRCKVCDSKELTQAPQPHDLGRYRCPAGHVS